MQLVFTDNVERKVEIQIIDIKQTRPAINIYVSTQSIGTLGSVQNKS